MNDFVGFEPIRLDQLSKRLQSLAQAVDGNLDQIRNIISSLGGNVTGSSKTRYWVAKAHDDANDMSFRSKKAWEAYRLEQKRPPFIGPVAHPGTVYVNWIQTSEGGRQAVQDAQEFNAAINNTDGKLARQQLRALAQILRSHINDHDYTATFWSQIKDSNAPAHLARILHNQDVQQNADQAERKDAAYPQILSDDSKKILASLAASIAAASKQSGALPQSIRDKLTKPDKGDVWSSSMLFKYGPSGKAWDQPLLVGMARSIYDWRGSTRPVLGNSPTASGPGWWTSLLPSGSGSRDFVDPKILAEVDPTCAILDRLAESPDAARAFMADAKTGSRYTNLLVGAPPWVTGPDGKTIDLSTHAGAVIKAATYISRRDPGTQSQAATWAMLNTILAVKNYSSSQFPGDGTAKLPAGIRHAITDASLGYVPDLSLSARGNADNGVAHFGGDGNNPWEMRVDQATLAAFAKATLQDPEDIGKFHGAVLSYLRTAIRESLHGSASPAIDGAGQLDGMLRKETSLAALEKAKDKDLAVGMLKSLAAPGFDKIGNSIIPKKDGFVGDLSEAAKGVEKDQIASAIFSPLEGKVRDANDARYQTEIALLEKAVVEGYIDAEKLPNPLWDHIPKPDPGGPVNYSASFWVDGHIELKTAQQRSDWASYIERHGATYLPKLNDVRSSFSIPTDVRKGGSTG